MVVMRWLTRWSLTVVAIGTAQAQTSTVRPIEVLSVGDVRIGATYYDPHKPGPAVVVFRNCDQVRASVEEFGRKLSAAGVHVVTFDYRETAAPTGFTWLSIKSED